MMDPIRPWHRIKGHFHTKDAAFYQRWAEAVPDGETIVECGSLRGRSAACLLTALHREGKEKVRLVCIDIWPVYAPTAGHKGTALRHCKGDPLAALRMNLREFRGRFQCVNWDSREAARLFPDLSVWGVYLDSDHSHDHLRGEIDSWLPKVKFGGRIGGHDHQKRFPGVVKAVREIFGTTYDLFGRCWEWQVRD